MDQSKFSIEDAISGTEYMRNNLELLLQHLYPTYHCLKLVVKILLHGPDGSGKRMLARLAAKKLNINYCEEHVANLFDENIVGSEKKVKSAISKHLSSSPCLIYLTGYELFCSMEEQDLDRLEYTIAEALTELSGSSSQPIIFIAATNDFQRVYKTPLSNIFHHNLQIKPATLDESKEILQNLSSRSNSESSYMSKLEEFANTGEYYLGNLVHILIESEVQHYSQKTIKDIQQKDGIEPYSREPSGTRWMDIGGLGHIKKEIIDAIQLPIDYPQLKKSGLRRSGILLYGPPGTGKTLLAKAVATECSLNFIDVKGPELLNEYVGQSEDNVRKLFQKARDASPSVIFFDEIDSLAPNRGQAGDSGGVMDRMVSQMLAEMDGVERSDGVFVIGSTNRVDMVDPSLLRPGRFDKVLEVPLPVSKENRLEILQALTRKMKLAHDVDLEYIERLVAPNLSGADFQGLCSSSLERSLNRCIELVESGEMAEGDVDIVTTMDDFLKSMQG